MKYISEEELRKIEGEIGISLPSHFKEFHLNEHKLIKTMRESDSCPDDHSIHLATDADWIIQLNQMKNLPKDHGSLRNKICIGTDGSGNDYFISVIDEKDTKVYFVDHDGYEWDEIFDTEIDDFKWEHKGLTRAKNLKEFIKDFIRK